jgi:hypothetical protein
VPNDITGGQDMTAARTYAENAKQAVAFFKSKGLSQVAIDGILGNMQVESGFNTGAFNAHEGAIGLAQWENGRRTALQNYAKAHGGTETDLKNQLGYLWQELSTNYSGVLQELKSAKTPEQAATAWDAHYEVSSGSTRANRIANANAFASGTGSFGNVAQTTAANAGLSAAQPTAAKDTGPSSYEGQYTFVEALSNSVPEIKSLMATASSQGWTAQRFADALEATHWWKTNADTARTAVGLMKSDPATYANNLKQAQAHAQQIAQRMGINLTPAQLKNYAVATMFQGLDDATLSSQIASTYHGLAGGTGVLGGTSVDYDTQIKNLAAAYGVPVTQSWVNGMVKTGLVTGNATSAAEAALKQIAISTYPALKDQLTAGQTTHDIAQPYVAAMANTLEIPDTEIKLTDQTIQKALHGTTSNPPKPGQPPVAQSTPIYQFTNQLKQDPRWQKTDNAKADAYAMLHGLGQTFGFAS